MEDPVLNMTREDQHDLVMLIWIMKYPYILFHIAMQQTFHENWQLFSLLFTGKYCKFNKIPSLFHHVIFKRSIQHLLKYIGKRGIKLMKLPSDLCDVLNLRGEHCREFLQDFPPFPLSSMKAQLLLARGFQCMNRKNFNFNHVTNSLRNIVDHEDDSENVIINQDLNEMYEREQLITSLMSWKKDTFRLGPDCVQFTKYSMLDLEKKTIYQLNQRILLLNDAE